jgi:zinc protease
MNVETFSLGNGLDVVVLPDRRAPVVTHMVWYRNGSADDPLRKSGIAHFLEHLMFKGTAKYPAGEFSKIVAGLGGQENAFTSYDYTAYFQRVPKAHLARVMDYEADRMANLAFDEAVVAPERDVVLEERRMVVDANPQAQLTEEMMAASFLHHPYGIPIIGWQHEIESLNRDDAFTYYRRFYTPENAILVVAGDTDTDEVRRLAETTYGAVAANGGRPVRQRAGEPAPRAARRVTVSDARVEQPLIYKSFLAPSYRADLKAGLALDLAAAILGEGPTSRLYRALVVEKGLAAAAQGYYMGSLLDAGRLVFSLSPRPGADLAALEQAFADEIRRFCDGGPSESELTRQKTRLVAETIFSRDSQSSMARTFGAALAVGDTVADVLAWPARIEAVTAQEVRAAADAVLKLDLAVTGQLLPA